MAPKSPPPSTSRSRTDPRDRSRSRTRHKPHHASHHHRHNSTARMPFARKVRLSLFFALLLLLVVIYVVTSPASTRNSAFYKKTVALMDYRAGGPAHDDARFPDRPIHRAGGLHFAEGDHHLTPAERAAMEQGKLKGEPPVGPDGQPIGLDGAQIPADEVEIGPVDQSNQRGQRPLIDTDAKLRERLHKAEREAKKSADEKYRALKDIEDEVRKEREMRGQDVDAPLHGVTTDRGRDSKKKGGKDDAVSEDEAEAEDEDETPRKESSDESRSEKFVAGRKKAPVEPAEPAEKESAEKGGTKGKETDKEEEQEELEEEQEEQEAEPKSESKKKTPAEKQQEREEDEETHRLRTMLAEILAKSPVTIFSKTFCPFSLKAKRILTDAYTITPAPYIVELNEHPQGPALHKLLQKTTGRRTVPNVLVNGKSIGGGDETELLWKNGELPARIQQMAGKRVESVSLNYAYGQKPPEQGAAPKPVEKKG